MDKGSNKRKTINCHKFAINAFVSWAVKGFFCSGSCFPYPNMAPPVPGSHTWLQQIQPQDNWTQINKDQIYTISYNFYPVLRKFNSMVLKVGQCIALTKKTRFEWIQGQQCSKAMQAHNLEVCCRYGKRTQWQTITHSTRNAGNGCVSYRLIFWVNQKWFNGHGSGSNMVYAYLLKRPPSKGKNMFPFPFKWWISPENSNN